MPNHKTFRIKPLQGLIDEELGGEYADPFPHPFKTDAIEYLTTLGDESIHRMVFDPPYSQRQLKEMYGGNGVGLNHPINSSYWSKCKKEIARVMRVGGKVISFGWNTNGIGKKYNFEIIRIVAVAHGGQHNDTLATVEIKVDNQ